MKRTLVAAGSVIAAAAVAVTGTVAVAATDPSAEATRPNIIMIMTDDQAKHYLHVMPNVKRLASNGTTFTNMHATYPLCCPSRATYLTGQHAHNHKVRDNKGDRGGYGELRRTQLLPHWLDNTGNGNYHTVHVGKYLNRYGTQNPQHVPPGWDGWHGLVGGSTYQMWGSRINHNGTVKKYGVICGTRGWNYQTNVLSRISRNIIERRASKPNPFFLSVAPLAPHVEHKGVKRNCPNVTKNPRPAPRDRGTFEGKPLPRPYTFNEADVSDKPAFAVPSSRMTDRRIAKTRERYQDQLESLLSVDRMVGKIVDKLRATGQLSNTVIMFTTDNGYFNGEHRVPGGKKRAYPAATRLPMIIKGPGVPSGVTRRMLVSNVDWATTILDIANRPRPTDPRYRPDGRSLLPLAHDPTKGQRRELLFMTGPRSNQGETWYKAIRTKRYHFIEHRWWKDGRWRVRGRELYDLHRDRPYLTSLQRDPSYDDVQRRMAAKLHDLDDCSGWDCLHSSV